MNSRPEPTNPSRFAKARARLGSAARQILAGGRNQLPRLLGEFLFGLIFGALALRAGVPPVAAQASSLLIFAGSPQFSAVGTLPPNDGQGVLRRSGWARQIAYVAQCKRACTLAQDLVPIAHFRPDDASSGLPGGFARRWFLAGDSAVASKTWFRSRPANGLSNILIRESWGR